MKRYIIHGVAASQGRELKNQPYTACEDPEGLWVKWKDVPIWISVNDRMPNKDALYLIHAPSMDKESPLIQCAWYDPNSFEWSLLAKCWCEAITHWMPLPESPVPTKFESLGEYFKAIYQADKHGRIDPRLKRFEQEARKVKMGLGDQEIIGIGSWKMTSIPWYLRWWYSLKTRKIYKHREKI